MFKKGKIISISLIISVFLCIMLFSSIAYAGTENPYLAGGAAHSVFLDGNGGVWTWGDNYYGGIGDGSNQNRVSPYLAMSAMGVKAISAGSGHSVALTQNGDLWVWGRNDMGQLGIGNNDPIYTPFKLPEMNSVKTVISTYEHTMLIKQDGTVWGCGWNDSGQLGDGSTINRNVFTQSTLLSDVKELATGSGHTLVIKNDKSLWGLGRNNFGQVGNGSTLMTTTPAQLTGMTGIKGIAAGSYHSVAVKEDGTVWTWGWNNYGQLGTGTTDNSSVPLQVPGISGVKAAVAGYYHTLVLKDDGTVWAWGTNGSGEIGDGTYQQRSSPVQVQGLTDVVAIAAQWDSSLALRSDGTVFTWGYNRIASSNSSNVPVQVEGLPAIPVQPPTQIETGDVIIPVISTELNKYIQGDTVALKVRLTGTKPSDKTNSISFELDYDSDAFTLNGGSVEASEIDGYIPFDIKLNLGKGTTKTVNLSYMSITDDISLQEGAPVFTIKFKVKQNLQAGSRTFTLRPVNMIDSDIKVYNVNNDQPVTKTVEISNDAVMEGYAGIYLGDAGTDLGNLVLGSLNQSIINDTFGSLKFTLKRDASDPGTVINGLDAFMPDENGNLAARDSSGKIKGRFRVFTQDPSVTLLAISGAGYLERSYGITLNLGRISVISTAAAPSIIYPGDLGQVINRQMVFTPDGKINNIDFSLCLIIYKANNAGTATADELVKVDFTKDGKVDSSDLSLWNAAYKKMLLNP